jgi:penicillin-binding protein 1C
VRPLLLALIVLCAILLLLYASLRLSPFPALNGFLNRSYSSRVYDRNGVLLQVLPLEEGLRREWYDLAALPPELVNAFISLEDKNFYHHPGVDPGAMLRALWQNAQENRPVSGASTITMQLARLIVKREPGTPVTLAVKLREGVNALRLEARLTKKKILELYLNSLPFGSNVEGVGSAARTFFGTTPARLDAAQIDALAITPRRPASYNPFANPGTGAERYVYPQGMPHFVQYAASQYAVYPPELRLSADSALTEEINHLIRARLQEFSDARISNGSALVIDNYTGEIIVWAGSGDFFAEKDGQINGVLVQNQPGSSMKPFLYALALEKGIAPASALPDVPTDFGSASIYVPLNFNNRFNGPVLFRNALASSFNVPAVYLLYRLGVDNYLDKLAALGFASLGGKRESTGLSLALGSGEVTLLELARAFSVFPRDGSLPQLTYTLRQNGDPAERAAQPYTADTARIICDMLSDRRARAGGFGFADSLSPPYPAIFKTGTSNQFQDIVALGATRCYTAGVWMGNFSGETVVGKTGSSIPAEIVRAALDMLTQRDSGRPPQAFPLPDIWVKADICALSGMAPSSACPAVTGEFIPRSAAAGRPVCTWHYVDGGKAGVRYPAEYQRWLSGKNTPVTLFWQPAAQGGVTDSPGSANPLRFLYPADGAVFVYDPAIPSEIQRFSVDCIGGNENRATLLGNGVPLGESERPFSWTVPLARSPLTLTVVCGNERVEIRVEGR